MLENFEQLITHRTRYYSNELNYHQPENTFTGEPPSIVILLMLTKRNLSHLCSYII